MSASLIKYWIQNCFSIHRDSYHILIQNQNGEPTVISWFVQTWLRYWTLYQNWRSVCWVHKTKNCYYYGKYCILTFYLFINSRTYPSLMSLTSVCISSKACLLLDNKGEISVGKLPTYRCRLPLYRALLCYNSSYCL